MILGLTKQKLESQEAFNTAIEITQQPRTLAEQYNALLYNEEAIKNFLSKIYSFDPYRIILSGAGTSEFAGSIIESGLKKAHPYIESVPSTSMITNPGMFLANVPTLMVHIARSGNSPESVAAADLADKLVTDVFHLVITCNREGELAKKFEGDARAMVICMPQECNDKGFAMTSSVTAMLLTGYIALSRRDYASFSEDVDYACRFGETFFAGDFAKLSDLAGKHCERYIFLGGGVLRDVCRESALKTLELTDGRIASLNETPTAFRHGPKTFVNSKTMTVLMMQNDPHARKYEKDLLEEICSDGRGNTVVVLTNKPDSGLRGDYIFSLKTDGLLKDEFMLTLIYLFFAQSLAFLKAFSLGGNIDSPCADGSANRVVKGVNIYEL